LLKIGISLKSIAISAICGIQHFMKPLDPLKVEKQAIETLTTFLTNLPRTRVDMMPRSAQISEIGDIHARFHLDQELVRLHCEVKTSGQPRYIRAALTSLRGYHRIATPFGW
jgi:hypothetical protein